MDSLESDEVIAADDQQTTFGALSSTVAAGRPSSGWYQIKYSGHTGWSSGSYLKAGTAAPPSVPHQPLLKWGIHPDRKSVV